MKSAVAVALALCALSGADAASLRAGRSAPKASHDKCALVHKALAEAEAAQKLAETYGNATAILNKKLVSFLRIAGTNVTAAAASNFTLLASEVRATAGRLRNASSQRLNDALQSAADQLHAEKQSPSTVEFLRTLRLCARCSDYERVGEAYDGGYITCADGLAKSGLQAAYSYGVHGYDGWGMTLAQKYNIPLYEYDCFDHTVPPPRPGVSASFSPECIKGKDQQFGPEYKTFKEHMALSGHGSAPNSSVLLKIDVEGAEWAYLSQEDPANLRQVRQMNLELHNVCGGTSSMDTYLKAMQTVVNAGFAVTHLHGNNHGGMCQFGQYQVPKFIELTLIRRPAGSSACPAGIPYHIPEDSPCDGSWNRSPVELPDAVLPSSL